MPINLCTSSQFLIVDRRADADVVMGEDHHPVVANATDEEWAMIEAVAVVDNTSAEDHHDPLLRQEPLVEVVGARDDSPAGEWTPQPLLPGDRYRPAGADFAVEFLGVIEHLDGECFFFASELEGGWHSP